MYTSSYKCLTAADKWYVLSETLVETNQTAYEYGILRSISMCSRQVIRFFFSLYLMKTFTNVTIQYLKALLKLYCKKKELHNFQYNVLFTIRYLLTLLTITYRYLLLLYGKQFLGEMVGSHWLIFGRDVTVRTITMETVRLCIFFFRSREIQSRTEHKK